MSKAKPKTTMLAVSSETIKGDMSTPIRKAALELGQAWERFNECDEIGAAARRKIKDSEGGTAALLGVEIDATALEKQAERRREFLQQAIYNSEPMDAVDSFILLVLLLNDIEGGECWVKGALAAGTESERKNVLEKSEEEHKYHMGLLEAALRGMSRGLGVTAPELGLEAFHCTGMDRDFTTAVSELQSRAKGLGL